MGDSGDEREGVTYEEFPLLDEGSAFLKRKREEVRNDCPFLDTINREVLDFDFEKVCSVTLATHNVYACLVCGSYFQGRGPKSPAYFHSLQQNHHVFINLTTERVYCLPDGYEVEDSSFEDIRYQLNPTYDVATIKKITNQKLYSRALDGEDFLPGVVGLNNIKHNDYLNVILHVLSTVQPLRNFFLRPQLYCDNKSVLVQSFGELVRKIWNPRNFRAHVSPHEVLQAVSEASKKRFRIGARGDPLDFLAWMLNTLHRDLGGNKKRKSSIMSKVFRGDVRVTTYHRVTKNEASSTEGEIDTADLEDVGNEAWTESTATHPFFFLSLDLPEAPLFKDSLERNMIPQVPIFSVLEKYNGQRITDIIATGERKRYVLSRLPHYLIVHIKRLKKNQFRTEKNPTIVTFPVKNLELRQYCQLEGAAANVNTKYDLIANVVHEGRPGEGQFRCHLFHEGRQQWYEVQDLEVQEILAPVISLSESYIQIYKRHTEPPTATTEESTASTAQSSDNSSMPPPPSQ